MLKHIESLEGENIIDIYNKEWKIKSAIGKGGFGYIYLAGNDNNNECKYVVKIEPKSNGPLFVEQNFYQRIGKIDNINKWIKENNIQYLGIPRCYGFGTHIKNNKEYRFIILDRLGCDLQKIITHNNNKLPKKTVYKIGLQVLNILRYLHNNGYAHADIKAANITLDYYDNNKIYLIDYGLSYRFVINNKHVNFRNDPKKMHNGTIEFTSIDAHNGACPSRRGDLEILGYCMIKWLCGKLPWENNLKDKEYVKDSKIKYFKDTNLLMRFCFDDDIPIELFNYINEIKTLKYYDEPNYEKIKNILNNEY
nr:serine/threonine protein kinase [Wadden Sea poxvirus]